MIHDLDSILKQARAIDSSRSYRVQVGGWLHSFNDAMHSPECCLYVLPGFDGTACQILDAETPEACLAQLKEHANKNHETDNSTF